MIEARVCAVCSRPLNLLTPPGNWIHTDPLSEDHPPVPVDPTDVPPTLRCDFCSGEPAVATLPVRPFEIAPGHMSGGAWAVCAPCQHLIESDRWTALAHRAARAIADQLTHQRAATSRFDVPTRIDTITAQVTTVYRRVRAHITGPIAPR